MKAKQITLWAAVVLAIALALAAAPAPALAATCTSTGTGNWSSTGTWDCGDIPQAGDDVTIAATHVVTVDSDTAALASLTVAGTVRFDATGTGRTMTVTGDIVVNGGGVLDAVTSGSTTAHALMVGGNVTNNGTLNLSPVNSNPPAVVNITFNGAASQALSGANSVRLHRATLDKGALASKVVASVGTTMRGGANSFTWTNGTWEQNAGQLQFSGGDQVVDVNGGMIISGAGLATMPRALIISGTLTVDTTGSLTTGNGTDQLRVVGTTTFTNGSVKVQGRLNLEGGTTTFQGAAVSIDPQVGSNVLKEGRDAFFADSDTNVSMTSGSITLVDPISATGNGRDLKLRKTDAGFNHSFSGGTIYFGDGISNVGGADGFETDTNGADNALWNVVVNGPVPASGSRALKLISAMNVQNTFTINSGGSVDANTKAIRLLGNWVNDGAFTANNGRVAFNGTTAQTVQGLSVTSFFSMTINNASGVTLAQDAVVNSELYLAAGDLDTDAKVLDLGASSVVTGTFDVVGTTRRTSFATGTSYDFSNGEAEITFDSADTLPTEVTVYLQKVQPGGFPYAVNRSYRIEQEDGSNYSATVRLRYKDAELNLANGATEDSLALFRYDGANWVNQGKTASDSTANWIELDGVTAFSEWTISGNLPNAIGLRSFGAGASPWSAPAIVGIVGAAGVLLIGWLLARRRSTQQ